MRGISRRRSTLMAFVAGSVAVAAGAPVLTALAAGEPPKTAAGEPPAVTTPSAPPAPPAPARGPDKKQIAAMMAMHGKPGKEHELLASMVGEFEGTLSMSMGPGMPPITAKTRMHGQWVLGQRFVQVTSTPAPGEELPMESISYFGFDRRANKGQGAYTWTGFDNTDTYSVHAEGAYDEATRTFTLLGENEEPGMGKVPFKTVIAVGEGGSSTMSIWFKMGGGAGAPGADKDGWFKVVTIEKKRVGGK